ncbi:GntR family transcriptional regulator [Gordonia sp. VNQ95]|jgi:DNA-binding transcriptional regulator YhcF (GntR family)|uniref:GntR family transcriptional regulator n=1 Tax=Gordonia TaxID=2053 RepID=UPI0032B378F9
MSGQPDTPVDLASLLHIDPTADSPPFEQVRLGVIGLVDHGTLLVGARIPTVRALATDLHLAANTVARSYRELEAAGIIETRGRHGSFIKAGPDARLSAAQRATVDHVKALREQGIDDDVMVTLLLRALGRS